MRRAASGRHCQEIAQSHGMLSVFTLMCQLVCQESRKLLKQDADALIVDALCFDFDGALLGVASTSPDGVPLLAPLGATHSASINPSSISPTRTGTTPL
jgi:hypothetical protein